MNCYFLQSLVFDKTYLIAVIFIKFTKRLPIIAFFSSKVLVMKRCEDYRDENTSRDENVKHRACKIFQAFQLVLC